MEIDQVEYNATGKCFDIKSPHFELDANFMIVNCIEKEGK
jgi:hypothetical protein